MIAGASAEIAFKSDANIGFGRVGIFVEKLHCCHHHARGAVSTLESMVLLETALHRVKGVAVGKSFDRGYRETVDLSGEHRARLR